MSTINSVTEIPKQAFSHQADRFLRIREMLWRVGLSRSSMYRMMNKGNFPRQIKLNGTTSVWSEKEIMAWMEQQKVTQTKGVSQDQEDQA